MTTQTPTAIPDVQNSADSRQLAINKVGIKSIRHPIKVMDKNGGVQHTIAMFNMYVGLPHNFKGTHMSRFVEILNSHEREISVESFEPMLREIEAAFGVVPQGNLFGRSEEIWLSAYWASLRQPRSRFCRATSQTLARLRGNPGHFHEPYARPFDTVAVDVLDATGSRSVTSPSPRLVRRSGASRSARKGRSRARWRSARR
mgnify:CR=1 FL=1